MRLTFERPTAKSGIILLGAVGLFVLIFAQISNTLDKQLEIPSPKEYAPNFWFDSEEQYYPANPLDFYYDEELNELYGEDVKVKYDSFSLEEKLNNFVVFYKIDEKSEEIVYQYWLFYVFNDANTNEHYGDWEFVFVFVDKETKKVNRVIGSAHTGTTTKIIFSHNELINPNKEHSTFFVEKGSHANISDGNNNGIFEGVSDITNINSYGYLLFSTWSKEDLIHGVKVFHKDLRYKFISTEELKDKFLIKYDEERSLLTKEKSPTLGALPVKFGEKKIYAIPFDLAGAPAGNIWSRPEYKDSYAAVPVTGERVVAFGERIIEKTVDVAMTPFRLVGESIGESVRDINALLGEINPFRAGIVEIVNDINTKKENFDKQSEEIASEALVDLFIGDPTRIIKEQIKNLADKKEERRKDSAQKENEVKKMNIPIAENTNIDKLYNEEITQKVSGLVPIEKTKEDNGEQNMSHNINAEKENKEKNNNSELNKSEKSDVLENVDKLNSDSQIASSKQNLVIAQEEPISQTSVVVAYQPPPALAPPPIPQVTSHTNGAQVNAAQVTLAGTAAPNIWVIIDKGFEHREAKSDDNGAWLQSITLNSGSNTFLVKGRNLGSAESPALSFLLTYGTPPTATISFANYKIYNINFTVQWSGAGQNALRYDVQYKEGESGSWQNWILQTTDTSKEFSAAKDNVTYYFRVKAIDQVTNLSSDWVHGQAEIMQMPVVINEIAWMGTQSHSSDEWIELYNRSNSNINLAGWVLKSADGIPNISLSGIINANGYYLFERTADTTIADVAADQIYTGALNDSVEIMEILTPENKVIDRVSAWYAGSSATRSSMERINPAAGGDTQENWATNNGVAKNGTDASGNTVNGTPRAQNSVYNSSASVGTYIADTTVISANTIWSLAASPYLLMSNSGQSPKVSSGTTLTIEPGVIIKPLNKNHTVLEVQGTLKAEGASSSPIKFTSKEASPAAGDFGTAILFTSSSQNSSLKYVTFEYGGYFSKDMVKVDGSKVVFDTVTFKNSPGAPGLYLKNSTSEVSGSIFQDVLTGVAIEGSAGSTIQNSSFTNVTTGVEILAGAKATVSNNSFSQAGVAISMRASSLLSASGNSATHNGSGDGSIKGILVTTETGEEVTGNVVWKSDLPYVLISNSNKWLTVALGATLTLEPGVIIKPKSSAYPSSAYNAIEVKGNLIAQGTESQPVIVTSFRDDNALYGGDTNNDGSATSPAANDWHKILIKVTSTGSNLSHMKIRYGGSWSANPLMIEEGASVLQSNVVIE